MIPHFREVRLGMFAAVLFAQLAAGNAFAASVSGANSSNLSIPDHGTAFVSSTITISGVPAGAVVTGIDAHFSAVHTYSGDLVVDLNADSTGAFGNVHLWNREGGSDDNPARTVNGISTYNGLSPNRTWYLYARDYVTGDTGYIDEWSITVYYSATMSGTLTPSSPSCTIAAGASSCNVNLTWTTTNPESTSKVTSNYPSANTTVFSTNNGGPSPASVPYNSRSFFLYNNGKELARSDAAASCASGIVEWKRVPGPQL
ncbi:MAG TPA: hypothetical protein VM074_04560 [Solimonas sp.]|nr:hypothetical protein [Solimonas sp.]